MIVRLLVSNDKANVKKVVLRSDTVIGRSSDCNLRIASKEVSRKHCSILLSDRVVRVRDLGSANGTFLNGSQIEAVGRVAWTRRTLRSGAQPDSGVGVEFLGGSSEQLAALDEFLTRIGDAPAEDRDN